MESVFVWRGELLNRIKWGRGRIRLWRGTLGELRRHVPRFEMRHGVRGDRLMVRQPLGSHGAEHVVSRVSGRYSLVQHNDVFDLAEALVERFEGGANSASAVLITTPHGERMDLTVDLPSSEYTPSDGYTLAARMRLLNSVDTSTALFGNIEFLRHVCSNGMVGWRGTRIRRRHVNVSALPDVRNRLLSQFAQLNEDASYFEEMLSRPVPREQLIEWVDGPLATEWDVWAAARVFHIAARGHDGPVVYRRGFSPHRMDIENPVPVAGACAPARNVYHVAQALSFVASRLEKWAERNRRLASIPALLQPLMN